MCVIDHFMVGHFASSVRYVWDYKVEAGLRINTNRSSDLENTVHSELCHRFDLPI